jgi:hypothetical protein
MEQKENMKRSGNWNKKDFFFLLVQKVLENEKITFGKLKWLWWGWWSYTLGQGKSVG